VIGVTIMPRLVLGVCLLIDVFVKQRVELMYKAIVWLVILKFHVIIGMVKHQIEKDKLSLDVEFRSNV
jgi:hypothetical protein